MAAMAVAAGAMALGSLVQLYNAEKARGAEKQRLKDIEKLYNSIKPPDYDLTILDPPQLHTEKLQEPQFSDPMAAPKFNMDKLKPEELKMVGKYIPDVAPYIAEENPRLLERTADMSKGREAQLNALKRFQEIGAGGFDPEYQQKVQDAARRAQTEAQSRQQSILQDFARRGQGGSGLSLAAQLGGASQAMDRNAETNLAAAAQAYRNQLGALSQGAELGSRIQGEDQSFQGRNADIINSFNARTAANRQGYENQRVGSMNDAQRYNLGVEQGLANQNVAGRNRASEMDQARQDNLAKYTTEFNRGERNRVDQLAQDKYGRAAAERAFQNQTAMSQYNANVGAKDRVNQLKQQGYQNLYNQIAGKSQNALMQNQAQIGATQDRNAAIQGVLNYGQNYATRQQDRDDRREELDYKYYGAPDDEGNYG